MVNYLFGPSDSNKITAKQVIDKIKSGSVDIDKIKKEVYNQALSDADKADDDAIAKLIKK